MDSRSLKDSQYTLDSTSATIHDPNEEIQRLRDNVNIINSKFQFYASKKLSNTTTLPPNCDYRGAGAKELDSYMDTLLDKYLMEKMVDCALKSSPLNLNSNANEQPEGLADLINLKLEQCELNKREDEAFLKQLKEGDRWREFERDCRERSNEAMKNPEEASTSSSQLSDAIKKDTESAKKLEEISKALLMGVNINYLEDEESRKIMFKENL